MLETKVMIKFSSGLMASNNQDTISNLQPRVGSPKDSTSNHTSKTLSRLQLTWSHLFQEGFLIELSISNN